MSNRLKTVTEKGKKFVLVPMEAWLNIAGGTAAMPPLPPADADGNMDALEFARATIARGIIRDRLAAGLSQAELARRAGMQPAVLNRIEKARVVPDESTMKKIDAALSGRRMRSSKAAKASASRDRRLRRIL